jgi:hypothetical protein
MGFSILHRGPKFHFGPDPGAVAGFLGLMMRQSVDRFSSQNLFVTICQSQKQLIQTAFQLHIWSLSPLDGI